MLDYVQVTTHSPESFSQPTQQLGAGNSREEEPRAKAERLLENGSIPLALQVYRSAKIVPDMARLTSAAAAQRKLGRIYPEIYDFLIETLSWGVDRV